MDESRELALKEFLLDHVHNDMSQLIYTYLRDPLKRVRDEYSARLLSIQIWFIRFGGSMRERLFYILSNQFVRIA